MKQIGNDGGWWYVGRGGPEDRWSDSWTMAHHLHEVFVNSSTGLRAVPRPSASLLDLGDVICYDFDGGGQWHHSAIVVARDSQGEPLVNAHSASVRHKHWSYRHAYLWTERTRYAFLHIVDDF